MNIKNHLKPRYISILILPFIMAISVVLTYLDFERRESSSSSKVTSEVNEIYSGVYSTLNQFYWDSVDTTIGVTYQGVQKNIFQIENTPNNMYEKINTVFTHSFSRNKSVSQIRWIDKNGLERYRMNRILDNTHKEKITVVHNTELQDKSERYYFKETRKLESGYIYLSKLDLNIENHVIVFPHQPTIRIATPIRNEENQFEGIIIINFDLTDTFQKIKNINTKEINIDLFNDQGSLRYSNTLTKSSFLDLLKNNILDNNINIMQGYYEKREEFEKIQAAPKSMPYSIIGKIDYAPQIRAQENIFLVVNADSKYLNSILKSNILESLSLGLVTFLLGLILLTLIHRSDKKVVKLNKALKSQLDITEKSRDFKSNFLANMSHEIRTPMTAISGLLDLLLKEKLDSHIHKRLTIIKESSDGLRRIINDILDLSKIESGKSILSESEFRPSITIERCLSTFNGSASLSGSELRLDMDPSLFFYYCYGDEYRIEQIINNLLSNAIKFSNSNPVKLNVTSIINNDGSLDLTCAVVDEGIGMSDELVKQLGESFIQADNSISQHNNGTGLGLSIAKELLRSMGSDLVIKSQLGKGSEFSFTLKLNVIKKENIFDRKNIDIYELNVWLINKENKKSDFINKLFRHWGCNATAISTQDELSTAIHQNTLNSTPLDFIVFDLEHPIGLDDVHNIIEKFTSEQLQKTTLVLMTSSEKNILKYKSSHAKIKFINKPVTVSSFLELLQNLNLVPNIQLIEDNTNSAIKQLELDIINRVREDGAPNILLVEDNLTNQSVIYEIFKSINIEVTLANNGKDAIEIIKKSNFDMVFMDIQMPVMDGLEATKIIRNSLNLNELPIIALSAGVTEQEFYKSNKVGMNTHVPKPIDLKKLMQVVIEYWPKSKKEDIGGAHLEVNNHEISVKELNNLARFDLSNTIYKWLGESAYEKVLRSFLSEYASLDIKKDTLTYAEKASFVHKLKGVSGNIGAMSLFESCEYFEEKLRDQDTSIDTLLDELKIDINTLKNVTVTDNES